MPRGVSLGDDHLPDRVGTDPAVPDPVIQDSVLPGPVSVDDWVPFAVDAVAIEPPAVPEVPQPVPEHEFLAALRRVHRDKAPLGLGARCAGGAAAARRRRARRTPHGTGVCDYCGHDRQSPGPGQSQRYTCQRHRQG